MVYMFTAQTEVMVSQVRMCLQTHQVASIKYTQLFVGRASLRQAAQGEESRFSGLAVPGFQTSCCEVPFGGETSLS